MSAHRGNHSPVPYHHSDGKGDAFIRLLAHQQHLYAVDSQRGVQISQGLRLAG